MEKAIQEMIEKGLVDIQFRSSLEQIPVWLVTSGIYKPDPIDFQDWLKANKN